MSTLEKTGFSDLLSGIIFMDLMIKDTGQGVSSKEILIRRKLQKPSPKSSVNLTEESLNSASGICSILIFN